MQNKISKREEKNKGKTIKGHFLGVQMLLKQSEGLAGFGTEGLCDERGRATTSEPQYFKLKPLVGR